MSWYWLVGPWDPSISVRPLDTRCGTSPVWNCHVGHMMLYAQFSSSISSTPFSFFQRTDIRLHSIHELFSWPMWFFCAQIQSEGETWKSSLSSVAFWWKIPSGKLTVCYWKWLEMVDLIYPLKMVDLSIVMLVITRGSAIFAKEQHWSMASADFRLAPQIELGLRGSSESSLPKVSQDWEGWQRWYTTR